jgi:hypothetical protein
MPRILSNGHLHHSRQRRSSLGSSSGRMRLSMSNDPGRIQQSVLNDWFGILTGPFDDNTDNSSRVKKTTAPTSANSSLSSSGMNTPPALSDSPFPTSNEVGRQIISRRSSTGSTNAPSMSRTTVFCEDTWGQFVDTAEAEKELVRHSRVLSKKESPTIRINWNHLCY